MLPRPDHADQLDACLDAAWTLLTRAVVDRRSAFRTLNLATVALDGAPVSRTVVLRGVDRDARRISIHTDRRSAKIAELARDPRIAVHGYDPGAKIQLRLAGVATVHGDDAIADAGWAHSQPMSRACYAIEPAPATPITAPLPAPVDTPQGRENFRVVRVEIATLDWLWLAADGHRRARFDWTGEKWRSSWLVP